MIFSIAMRMTERWHNTLDNNEVIIDSSMNLFNYGILRFRRGGGLFRPDPKNKVTVNGLI